MKGWFSGVILWMGGHEKQLLCIAGIVVVAFLSYVFGVLKGSEFSQRPITVMRPLNDPVVIPQKNESIALADMKPQDCVYVGSIKGKKYYPPSCSYAKKVAKENLRCFRSDQDAIDKGYVRSTSCK